MSDELQKTDQPAAAEPSVLDYIKSLFKVGGVDKIRIPEFVEEEQEFKTHETIVQGSEDFQESSQPSVVLLQPPTPFPWRSLLALFFALIAQSTFEPPQDGTPLGIALYILSFSFLGWGIYRSEWTLAPLVPNSEATNPLRYRRLALIISIALAFWAFIVFKDNRFTLGNIIIGCSAVALFVYALWRNDTPIPGMFRRIGVFLKRDPWTVHISHWTLLLLASTLLVLFFRFYQTASLPAEPISDHAEKILDVYDVSQGQTHIFFIRNTGRESFQMYWTLLVAYLFGTGLSFLSLKLGTAILGFLTLPFIYLLGKEIGGKRVGLLAFILAGIGYWPNVISRVGLRFPLYPLFAAPTLFFLIRSLRTRNRNDFLLSG